MKSMATNTGKGKTKKTKKTAIPLSNFLAEDTSGRTQQGFNVVNIRPKIDWAESMEDDLDDTFTLNFKKDTSNEKVLLPTAPKSTRGPDFDLNQVPVDPPFKAYLGNLPYDVSEQEITRYFSKLNIIDVRLPLYNGRQRGFAYAEFPDRQSLIDALTMNGDTFRSRQLKVGLPGDNNSENSRDNNRDDKREDRTATNWRTNPTPREDDSSRDMNRDNFQSYNSRNGANDSSDRNMQRNRSDDSFGRRFDNDRGFKPSNDSGFDRGFNRPNNSNDRGFDRQNDRGFDRQSDRGFDRQSDRGFDRQGDRGFERQSDRGFDRQSDRGYDRPNNRYGNRFNDRSDRTDGVEENRDHGYESNERFGRRFEDSNRQTNRNFNDRRGDRTDNRRDYGFDRRGDSQYEARNTSSPPQRNTEEEGGPKERPKLNLKPRSKPIEKSDDSITASSAIFGGAKPVNTAAREQEIEQKLLKEKEQGDKKRDNISTEDRIRRISSGSNVSGNSRSRKGSDSGRDFEDNYRNNSSNRNSRSRKTSEKSNESAPKYIMTRNKESTNSQKYVSVRTEEKDGRDSRSSGKGNNNSNRVPNNNVKRDNRHRENVKPDRPPRLSNRSDEEEDHKKVAYTTTNKFAHLPTEDYEEDEAPIDGHNASD